MTTKKTTLIQALVAAQSEADRIAKDSRNDFARFDYTSAESMMEMWTAISARHGFSLYPAALSIDGDTLRGCWVLEHVSGDTREIQVDWPIVEAKGKPRDKALATARTSSLGYLIRDLLIAPRVHPTDDMDHPTWSQTEPPPPAPKKTRARKAPPAEKAAAPPKSSSWSKPYQDRLLGCPGMPTPSEVEAICAAVAKGAHPSDLPADRIAGLIDYIASSDGQGRLSALRDGGAA